MTLLERFNAGMATSSAAETQALGEQLASLLPPDCTLALHGDLGVGKTTFVQGLARGFGVLEPVTSPTYTLFTLHRGRTRTLVHFDAYRLANENEMDALMIEDFLVSPWCLAVEWPSKVTHWLPPDAWHLEFGIAADERHTVQLRRSK